MEYLGLILEFVLLGFAIYVYLISRGLIKAKSPEAAKATELFRDNKKPWIRILALGLMAVMTFNIILHLMDLFQ